MKELIKKIFTVIIISILAALIAGIYGILHDQITYIISPEYYTKFKFIQFNIDQNQLSTRVAVSLVGFLATWWFGLVLGFILGILTLRHKDWKTMLKFSLKSIYIALLTTFIIEILGFFYGFFLLAERPKSYFNSSFIPENIIDFKNYITVGCIHNFGYIGGIIGLILGIIYSYKKMGFPQK